MSDTMETHHRTLESFFFEEIEVYDVQPPRGAVIGSSIAAPQANVAVNSQR